mgnify:CR=1 FL=1
MRGFESLRALYLFEKGEKLEAKANELEEQIIQTLKTTQVFYWPDEYDEPIIDDIRNINKYTR